MPNYVQLGQGLRDVGQSLAGGYDFLNNQRQLDISQQRADNDTAMVKLSQDKQAEEFRVARNREANRKMLAVFQEAGQSGESNFNDFFSKNKSALDEVLNAYGTSNSSARAATQGKRLTGVVGQDGKFDVMAVDNNGVTSPLVVDGQPARFDGEQIYHLAAREMAANGMTDVVSTLKVLESNKNAMPPEEYHQKRAQLTQKLDGIQQAAEQHGIDTDGIMDDYHAAGQRHSELDKKYGPGVSVPAAPPAMIAAPTAKQPEKPASLGDDLVGRFFPSSIGAKPTTAAAEPTLTDRIQSNVNDAVSKFDVSREQALMDNPDTPTPVYLGARLAAGAKAQKTLHEIPYQAGKAVLQYADNAVGKVVDGFMEGLGLRDGQPKGDTKPATDAKPVSTEQFIKQESKAPAANQTPDDVVQKTAEHVQANPPRSEAQASAIIKRSVSSLGADEPKRDGNGLKNAHYYATALSIMGLPPDKEAVSNLMAGDSPDGRNFKEWKEQNDLWKARAQNEVQWAHVAAQNYATDVKRSGDRATQMRFEKQQLDEALKLRREKQQEIAKAFDISAAASVPDGMKDREGYAKTLSAKSQLAYFRMGGQLKLVGHNLDALQDSLAELPIYAEAITNFTRSDEAATKHNAVWHVFTKDRYAPLTFMAKVGSTVDPKGFAGTMAEAIFMDSLNEAKKTNAKPDMEKLRRDAWELANKHMALANSSPELQNIMGPAYDQKQ